MQNPHQFTLDLEIIHSLIKVIILRDKHFILKSTKSTVKWQRDNHHPLCDLFALIIQCVGGPRYSLWL